MAPDGLDQRTVVGAEQGCGDGTPHVGLADCPHNLGRSKSKSMSEKISKPRLPFTVAFGQKPHCYQRKRTWIDQVFSMQRNGRQDPGKLSGSAKSGDLGKSRYAFFLFPFSACLPPSEPSNQTQTEEREQVGEKRSQDRRRTSGIQSCRSSLFAQIRQIGRTLPSLLSHGHQTAFQSVL